MIFASWKCGKLLLLPMENPFTGYGKGQALSHSLQTGFPQQCRIRQFTHITTTPATANIYPIHSYPTKK